MAHTAMTSCYCKDEAAHRKDKEKGLMLVTSVLTRADRARRIRQIIMLAISNGRPTSSRVFILATSARIVTKASRIPTVANTVQTCGRKAVARARTPHMG